MHSGIGKSVYILRIYYHRANHLFNQICPACILPFRLNRLILALFVTQDKIQTIDMDFFGNRIVFYRIQLNFHQMVSHFIVVGYNLCTFFGKYIGTVIYNRIRLYKILSILFPYWNQRLCRIGHKSTINSRTAFNKNIHSGYFCIQRNHKGLHSYRKFWRSYLLYFISACIPTNHIVIVLFGKRQITCIKIKLPANLCPYGQTAYKPKAD